MAESAKSALWRVLGNPTATISFMLAGIAVGVLAIYRTATVSESDLQVNLEKEVATLRAEVNSLALESRRLAGLVTSLREDLTKLQQQPSTPKCEEAFIVVRSPVEDDEVLINGKSYGPTSEVAHSVCAGAYTVIVTKSGYIPYEKAFELRPGEKHTVQAKLKPASG